MPYYGLYIPPASATPGTNGGTSAIATSASTDQNSGNLSYVFRTKGQALEELKLHKDARLREFGSEDDAANYAQTGCEVVQTKYSDVKSLTAGLEKAAFRAPTKQELIEFRKIIESGDYERVKNIIWDNPRYLVSSGDTPTTLKEGYRYNALHVCAISKTAHIAELILQTVSNPKFVDLLTGKKNDQKMCKELCINLLDYYLNIPEKGRSETPLHLAAKNGCIDVIKVLTSYPECKMTPNSEGLLAKDIICTRNPEATPELCMKIKALFEENFFVPVLRSMDNAIPPKIGQPFSTNNPPNLNCDPLSPEVKIQALAGPMNKEQAQQFRRRWKTPPRIGSNTLSPIANNPFISPMKSRTPMKTPKSANINLTVHTAQGRALFQSPADTTENVKEDELFSDQQNGNYKTTDSDEFKNPEVLCAESSEIITETNNNGDHFEHFQQESLLYTLSDNQLKHEKLKAPLCPGTPLMKIKRDAFYTYREQNVPSPMLFDGPAVMESSSVNDRDLFDTPGYRERHIKISDTEKGLEIIGRELAKEQQVGWSEYWDFLHSFVDIGSMEGLQQLENYLSKRLKEEEMAKRPVQSVLKASVVLDDVCSALEKFGFGKDGGILNRNGYNGERNRFGENESGSSNMSATTQPQSTTPYTCVEKSLQVFAKRMTKSIIHNIDNVVSINDTLLSELKRLKSLICSFKEDTRFLEVDFTKVHSRIGNLISIYLESSQEVTPTLQLKILTIIQNLLLTPGERREHMECVCSKIAYMLENPIEQVLPENLKTEPMCAKIWNKEHECDCQWETNLSRKTSRRSRMEARYKTHQQAKEQERISRQHQSTGTKAYRNPSNSGANDSSDELEDDVFWSDFGGSDTEDEQEEIWLTPPESLSRLSFTEDVTGKDSNEHIAYIFGNEPTKRDLDVLNAIFHIELDKLKYPSIHTWKTALLRYPNEEMDYFPSPSVIKKSHSLVMHKRQSKKTNFVTINNPGNTPAAIAKQPATPNSPSRKKYPHLSTAKCLFLSPAARGKSFQNVNSTTSNFTTSQTGNAVKASSNIPQLESHLQSQSQAQSQTQMQTQTQAFSSPINKLRGLFSVYRERLDSSPLSGSSASPAGVMHEHSSSEGSRNLSLLNISAME